MSPYEIISRKRDGKILNESEIQYFIQGFMNESIAEYQMTALLMAIYLRGMTADETIALTRAYIASGISIDLDDLEGLKVDKHSTGGVGDKVSIILAPLVASLGIYVPMMSGRGLGHSGGTLDKLESIPGFRTNLSLEEFHRVLRKHHLALIGQTAELVPADKRIYALRDVTATVDCIPLICASIMSKKIAEGANGLVLDVKYGSGAFMKRVEDAEALAKGLINIGSAFGQKVIASITSMEQPLGNKIGNWLEIEESLDCLNGGGPKDLRGVTLNLAMHMVKIARPELSREDAMRLCVEALDSGAAMQHFLEITETQGGDIAVLQNPSAYPTSTHTSILKAERDGYITSMNTYEIGMTSVGIGAGRLKADDTIDPKAGIILHKKCGDTVKTGDSILEIRTDIADRVQPALKRLKDAITLADEPISQPALILKEIA